MSQQVPTIEQLTQALTQMTLQRAQSKDLIEQLERQMPVLQGQLQLLQAQAKAAEEVKVED